MLAKEALPPPEFIEAGVVSCVDKGVAALDERYLFCFRRFPFFRHLPSPVAGRPGKGCIAEAWQVLSI